jgi:hypothetical protein
MHRVAYVVVATLFVVGLFAFPQTNAPRSLAEGELWQAWGGQIANRCCAVLPLCALPPSSCSEAEGSDTCIGQHNYDMLPGNRRACIQMKPMTTCDQSGTHVCAEQHDCVWDGDIPPSGACIKNFNTSNANAPNSCSPNCDS